jgi:hypothetical protein
MNVRFPSSQVNVLVIPDYQAWVDEMEKSLKEELQIQ